MNTSSTTDAALGDPERTERVGKAFAGQLADLDVSLIVCWDVPEDTVLAHVVARELGVGLGRAVEIEGILSLLQPLPESAQVALVAEAFRERTGLAGLAGVVRHGGGTVAAVAAATGLNDLADTKVAGARLVRPEPQ